MPNIKKIFDIEEFKLFYPVNSNQDTIKQFQISLSTMFRYVNKFSLVKDEDYLKLMRKEQVKTSLDKKIRNNTIPKGEKHVNWKGGNPWKRFADPQYIAWRNSVLQRDNYICQHCKRKCNKSEKGLAAHHVKSYKDYIDLRFDIDNGLTLCRECHMKVHGKVLVNNMIECACGCGTLFPERKYKKKRKYVNGHYFKGRKRKSLSEDQKLILSIKTKEARAKKFWSTKTSGATVA